MAEQTPNIPFPSRLELKKGNLAENWKKFHRVWENYEVAIGLNEKDDKLRKATLLTCLGPDAIELFESFPMTDDDRKDPDKVLDAFKSYCIGETNEIYERYNFNARNQECNETIDQYVSALRSLAQTCNYSVLEENLIRDRIVIGIRDNGTRKKLLQEKTLTLSKCIDICRSSEKTDERAKTMNQEEVSAIHKHTDKGAKKKDSKPSRECWLCGRKHAPNKEACPAWGEKCTKCGKPNHFAIKCQSTRDNPKQAKKGKPKRKKGVNTVNYELNASESDSEEDLFVVEEIQTVQSHKYPKKLFAKMKIENEHFKCQLDCGATVNIMSDTDYIKIRKDPFLTGLQKCNIILKMYNKSETKAIGKREFKVVNLKNKKTYNLEFVVVQGPAQILLGSQAIQKMKLITVNTEHILAVDNKEPLINEFEDIFVGEGKLPGKLHLELAEDAKPVQQPVRRVAIAVKPKLKQELQRLQKLGMIVPVQEPTDWISSMVVVMKSSKKVRLCIDPKPLNKGLKRNKYPIPTIEDILPDLTKAKVFTVVDAKNGFWHVELDKESSYLTTFGTPWGRYRWLRMPFGISPAPEEFQRRLNEALEGLEGIKAVHDDILVWGCGNTNEEATEDHDRKLRQLFDRCRAKCIKLNKDKLKYKQKEVTFMGHVIGEGGLKVDDSKIEAILKMPTPTDKQGVQRLLGMVNYVQKFAPHLSSITEPLRELIRKETEFVWEERHNNCMKQVQSILSSVPVLKFFDVNKQTVLQCDASESGLGACLMQDDHPIAYASRSLTTAEKNYAQIEKELLAIVFGMEKYEHYVYGRNVTVESDHKPLEIIHKKCLTSAPKRLQRMLLRLQKFDINIQYKPGSQMHMADTLSRAYLPDQNSRSHTETEVESVSMVEMLPVCDESVQEIKHKTAEDQQLQMLMKTVMEGWPLSKEHVCKDIQCYFPFREEVSLQDGLLFKGDRVIIPKAMKLSVIDKLHSSHIGIQGCVRRAREAVYWPNMNSDIEQYIQTCDTCKELSVKQQKETLHSHDIPSRPWEVIGIDLCECNGKDYLITVDYLSNFFEIDRLDRKTAKGVIPKLKKHIARYGIPDKVVSDNGPPFNGKEFREFAKTYHFKHVTSSPLYPRSNGKVENAVKTAKRLIKKAKHSESDANLALLDYRNTPTEGVGFSPAQVMFGRRTRTLLPMAKKLLLPENKVPNNEHHKKLKQNKMKQAWYYNKNAKDMNKLKPGDIVRVSPSEKNKSWKKARVETDEGIRSYKIQMEDGTNYRRNRIHLRTTHEPFYQERGESRIEHDDPNETRVLNPFSESRVLGDTMSPSAQCLGELKSPRAQNRDSVENRMEKREKDHQKEDKMSDYCSETGTSKTAGNKNNKTNYRTSCGRKVKTPEYLKDYQLTK